MKPTSITELFRGLPGKFDPEAAEGLSAVYQFDLNGSQGGHYHMIIDSGRCSIREGVHANPHVTITMSAEDCLGVLSGRLDGQSVFMSGRLRVSGDLGLAMQLKSLFPDAHERRRDDF
jgi:putative sterol carrier protein